jgi:hypothetical protein
MSPYLSRYSAGFAWTHRAGHRRNPRFRTLPTTSLAHLPDCFPLARRPCPQRYPTCRSTTLTRRHAARGALARPHANPHPAAARRRSPPGGLHRAPARLLRDQSTSPTLTAATTLPPLGLTGKMRASPPWRPSPHSSTPRRPNGRDADRAELHEEFTRLRSTISGSLTTSPNQLARVRALSATISQRPSAWKSSRAAIMRAIFDLGAANTPSLVAAAVNAANLLLAAPAPVISTSTSPAPPPVAEPPLPLRGITADFISGHLVFPTPRIPRAVAQHSPREDPLTRAPTAHERQHAPSMRLSSPSPPLSARTPRTPDTTLVLRRATDRRGRAPLPEPEALR